MSRQAPRVRVVLGMLLVAACGRPAAQAPDASAAPEAREVDVTRPEAAPFPKTVLLQGTLEAEHAVQLVARVDGPVTAVLVDLGDTVRMGQTLARIDGRDYRARVTQAHAELTQASNDAARYTGMEHPEAVSRQQVEQAGTRVETAEASLSLAQRQLTDTNARAPFAGAVVRRLVERGAYVRVGTPLFDLVSTGPLRLGLEIPERYLGAFDVGASLYVLTGENSEPRFDARVVRIAPSVNPATRTFRIEASVEQTHATLRPGAYVVAVLSLGMWEDALKVPRAAVYSVLGHDKVTCLVSGEARPKEVELLGERDGFAYVRGLTTADVVILGNVSALAPGTRVRAREAHAAGGGAR